MIDPGIHQVTRVALFKPEMRLGSLVLFEHHPDALTVACAKDAPPSVFI